MSQITKHCNECKSKTGRCGCSNTRPRTNSVLKPEQLEIEHSNDNSKEIQISSKIEQIYQFAKRIFKWLLVLFNIFDIVCCVDKLLEMSFLYRYQYDEFVNNISICIFATLLLLYSSYCLFQDYKEFKSVKRD